MVRVMARSKVQIYVPQTGSIYPSAAAAARALGVDPSNVGKALRGSRKSAGGYNFVAVTPDIAPDTLRQINEYVDQSLSPRQKRQQAKRRRAGRSRLSPEEKAAQKARASAARALQGTLRDANKLLEEYRRQGLDAVSGVVPELEKLKDIIGRNRKGGFNAAAKNLAQFSEREIRALSEALQRQMNRKGFKDIEAANSKKQAVAYQLGLSSPEELDNYSEVLPSLWHVLDLARQTQGRGYDRSLYNAVSEAMQAEMDPEELKNVLDQMAEDHEEYIAEVEADPETPPLDYAELSQKYADMLQAQESDEFDDLTGDDWITLDY